MILRMTVERPIYGYWDYGEKATFDFFFENLPREDKRGKYIRVGSFAMNCYCHVALGKTPKATLGNLRRRLRARFGPLASFEYVNEHEPNYFERRAFEKEAA